MLSTHAHLLGKSQVTVARLLRENLKVPFSMVRKFLDGWNIVQIALKLTAYLLALYLPLWPSFAQEQTLRVLFAAM